MSATGPSAGFTAARYGAIGSSAAALPTAPSARNASSAPPICFAAPRTTQPGPAASTAVRQARLFSTVFSGMNRR